MVAELSLECWGTLPDDLELSGLSSAALLDAETTMHILQEINQAGLITSTTDFKLIAEIARLLPLSIQTDEDVAGAGQYKVAKAIFGHPGTSWHTKAAFISDNSKAIAEHGPAIQKVIWRLKKEARNLAPSVEIAESIMDLLHEQAPYWQVAMGLPKGTADLLQLIQRIMNASTDTLCSPEYMKNNPQDQRSMLLHAYNGALKEISKVFADDEGMKRMAGLVKSQMASISAVEKHEVLGTSVAAWTVGKVLEPVRSAYEACRMH